MSAPREIKHHRSGDVVLTEVYADPGTYGWYYREKMPDSVAKFIRTDALADSPEVAAIVAEAVAKLTAENEVLREALIVERQRWWLPEYPNQPRPKLAVWFADESEAGLSGFDNEADRDAFHEGGKGPFLRRITGNENPQLPFRAAALRTGETG